LPSSGPGPATEPFLTLSISHRIGRLHLEVKFELRHRWTILFGPSGSGKTTILRTLSGLTAPKSGRIVAQDAGERTLLLDTAQAVNIPAHLRRTPLAPQAPNLFPNLTVRENLEFGNGAHPDPGMLETFELTQLLNQLPRQLSGGEAQRVNLARAAAYANPRLLLLDEPFTGLDLPLRSSLVDHMLAWQQRTGVPILSVTHDVAEAFHIGAEVIRLADGRVAAQGTAAEVLSEERERLFRQLAIPASGSGLAKG